MNTARSDRVGRAALPRGEGTRLAAQAAARKLLGRSGQSVTLQSVAHAVGRPRTGLLFHYPAGMPQLVATLAMEDFERLRQRLAAIRPRRPDPGRVAVTVFDHLVGLGRVAAAEIGGAWEWPAEVEFRVNRNRAAALSEAARIAGSDTAGRLAFLLAADAFADVLHERVTPDQAREKLGREAVKLARTA